jgi:hypothetical protein
MRVLLVEDDRRIASDVVRALKAAGYVVETVSDGEEAWFRGDTEIRAIKCSTWACQGWMGLRARGGGKRTRYLCPHPDSALVGPNGSTARCRRMIICRSRSEWKSCVARRSIIRRSGVTPVGGHLMKQVHETVANITLVFVAVRLRRRPRALPIVKNWCVMITGQKYE